jgi:hypothetical protein
MSTDTGNRIPSLTPPPSAPPPPMRTEAPRPEAPPGREMARSAEVVAGGSMAEAVAGAAAIVLSIVGLAPIWPTYLGPIAAIVIGAGLVLEGGAIAARYAALLQFAGDTAGTEVELGGGLSAEVLGGIAGIVLGILALIHIVPLALEGVAAIVFGATLLLGCAATAGLNRAMLRNFSGTMFGGGISRHVAAEAVSAAGGAQVLVGLGAVVLGIIALVLVPAGYNSEVLSLVAFLAVGASLLISGAALSGKFLRFVSWRR